MQALAPQVPLFRTIVRPFAVTRRLPDGSAMGLDEEGEIVQAEYSSGSIVSRHDDFCLVQTATGDYWYRDKQLCWHYLD